MKLTPLFTRLSLAAAAVVAFTGCESISDNRGALIGAGAGAVAGTVIGNGGIILPALGAVGGAVLGNEIAENDPLFD